MIFLEPKRIYRAVSQVITDNGEALPLDTCFTLREGEHITLVSWGSMVQETLQVADELAAKGIATEVIDVATVSPLDMDTILCSVAKTGRCVIIHEAARSGESAQKLLPVSPKAHCWIFGHRFAGSLATTPSCPTSAMRSTTCPP